MDLAEARLAGNTRGSSSADRFNVVVHVTAATSHIEHGPQVPAETSERLCCDGAVIALLEDAEGVPLSIGRKSGTIPSGEVIFKSPDNDRLWPYAPLPGLESGEDPVACVQRFVDPSLIDDNTCASQWYAGDDISWDLAVASLL